jgi:hypothetical protein
MQIKKIKGGIALKGENNVFISLEKNIKETDFDIFLSSIENPKADISLPGEYEINDVLVIALDPENSGKITMWIVDIEDVRIVYIDKELNKITKNEIDKVGILNILIWDIDSIDLKKDLDLVNEFDPNIFVPLLTDESRLSIVSNQLGVEIDEPEKKISVKSSDFAGDEPTLSICTLI